MSYTPENQHLRPSIAKIREGIKEFQAVCQARVDDGETWRPEHLDKLRELRVLLMGIDIDLSRLARDTE